MKKMTFKEYLESKQSLTIAATMPPVKSTTYDISKYCKLPVGVDKAAKEFVQLRPKQQIIIDITHGDEDHTRVDGIIFKHVDISKSDKPQNVLLSYDRFNRWLERNTKKPLR